MKIWFDKCWACGKNIWPLRYRLTFRINYKKEGIIDHTVCRGCVENLANVTIQRIFEHAEAEYNDETTDPV